MEEFVQEEEHFLEEALPIAPGERAFVADELAPFVGMLITNLMYAAPLERVIAARAERSLGAIGSASSRKCSSSCTSSIGKTPLHPNESESQSLTISSDSDLSRFSSSLLKVGAMTR